jgi:prevent-host-death family protein
VIKLSASKARQDLSSVIKGVRKGQRFLLSRHGEDVAAIVSVEDLELLQAIEDRCDARVARAALADAEKNGTVSWDQVRAELGL